jgi:hypothetical protein
MCRLKWIEAYNVMYVKIALRGENAKLHKAFGIKVV